MARSQSPSNPPQGDQPDWSVDPQDQAYADQVGADVVAQGQVVDGRAVSPFGPATMTVIQWCQEQVEVDDEDSAAAMEAMVRRVLASDTPDQVLAEELVVSVDQILGKPIVITAVRIGRTEYADGFPYYALLDCTWGSPPEPHTVSVGAFKVMAQLFAISAMGEWPQTVMFKQSDKPTRAGHRPISLVRAV